MKFVEDFSDTIQRKYAWNSGNQLEPWIKNVETGLNAYHPGKQMTSIYDHQMRYWLDRPLIQFINSDYLDKHYPGKTKYDRYEKWLRASGNTVGHPGADLHQRTTNFSNHFPRNKKITCDYNHLETIFSPDGQKTVSMWNDLKAGKDGKIKSSAGQFGDNSRELQEVANTDSANYAKPNRKSSGSAHKSLDEDPANSGKGLEADIRVRAKTKYDNTPERQEKAEQRGKEGKK